jgi:YihY family inner membrane protein
MLRRALEGFDRLQKRTRPSAVVVATFKKFSEDHSTNLAAMIAFWGFFSIFPLLLVLVTLLGWVLPAGDRASVLTRVAGMFPLLDPRTVAHLTGAAWPLIVGVVSALWSGLGVVRATQSAFDAVWEVPYDRRTGTLGQVARSLRVLATVGLGLVIATLLSGFVTSTSNGVNLGVAGRVGGYAVALLLDVGLVLAAFRILTTRSVSTRDVLPGGIVAGIVFFILQEASALIISDHLKSAQSTYGHFATVITILWWLYLQSVVTLLAAQLNVVLRDRLYPRSIASLPPTEADQRVLRAYTDERAHHARENATARVDGQDTQPVG